MLQLVSKLNKFIVLSLRTGGPIAFVDRPIINPHNMRIDGWYVVDRFTRERLVLRYQDIREVIRNGIVVNDHDVLSKANELVRLKSVLELDYELQDKPVYQEKKRLGKVVDYAVELESFFIQKLYVSQSLLKSLAGELVIDRQQVVEVTPSRVQVKGTKIKNFSPIKKFKEDLLAAQPSPSGVPPTASLTRE